jgi:hypothetical protein
MTDIPDFSDAEAWLVTSALKERYGEDVAIERADSELRLHPDDRELALCPTIFWKERGASFVLCKVGESRYRALFFYSVRDQYGTGREEYDDLADCVLTLLRVQADHEARRDAEGAAK